MRPSAQELLTAAECRAFFVTDPLHISYLTGLSVSAGAVLCMNGRFTLYLDSRYTEMADWVYPKVKVRDLSRLQSDLQNLKECGYESDRVTVQRKSLWKRKFKNTKFIPMSGILDQFRRSKDRDELAKMRRAEKLTRELLRRVPSALRVGVTERELARKLGIWALEIGADGLSFDAIVGFGMHTACPHHHPTTRSLRKGHLVQIDVGVKAAGFCGDLSEVYFTARPTAEQKHVYGALLEAKDRASSLVKAGASTQALDAAARSILRREGIEKAFTHALGHGVGMEVHEGVTISSRAPDQKLLAGEIITIEPGAYFPGKFGMRLEDMVFVK